MSDLDRDYDQPRGRSTAAAVVLATVFLTLLGAMVGVILGTTQRPDGGPNLANESRSPVEPSPTVTETVTTPATPGGTQGPTKTAHPGKTYPPTTRDDCPKQTDEKAGTDLHVVRFIKTRSSEVWICEGGGRHYYQGHMRGRPFTSATSDSSLFLDTVEYEAGIWSATNGSTTYLVSIDRLQVKRGEETLLDETAEDSYGE